MSRFDFADRDDYLDFRHEMLTGSEECHPDCADYGDDCVCGPCDRCDEGEVNQYIGDDGGGWSYHDVMVPCPTCHGTMIDPEARA